MRVVGLDLSLTSTGVAVVEDGRVVVLGRVTSTGRKDATLAERAARLDKIAARLAAEVAGADLVVVEGPSFGQQRQGGQHDRSGLWWLVVRDRFERGRGVVEVPPACRAKYATGRGNAPKDAVLAAVVRRYGDLVEVTGNDTADALLLAAMGARHLGRPLEPQLPLTHLAAMDAVHWPQKGGVTTP